MGGVVRQQAIAWANVDPDQCRHMAPLGYNVLTFSGASTNNLWLAYTCPNTGPNDCSVRPMLEYDMPPGVAANVYQTPVHCIIVTWP